MKKKLEIEEQKAKELYKTASPEFKTMLVDTFGQEFFCENIMDRVKTFEDALSCLPAYDEDLLIYQQMSFHKIFGHTLYYQKLIIIAKVLNQGWVPNWSNHNEQKWYPYFEYNASSGFVFSFVIYGSWNACAGVGSRLCFKSETLAKYAGTQFLPIYNKFLIK